MFANQVTVTPQTPIIKIKPYAQHFHVHWFVGSRCNFDCSYCPPLWHDKTSTHNSFDDLCRAWSRVIELTRNFDNIKYSLSFLGGELTINKDFLPFIQWLHKNYSGRISDSGMITNGTATQDYYAEIVKYFTWITFSTHSEFMNEAKFFENVLAAFNAGKKETCSVSVNIMDEPWHKLHTKRYKEFCDTHGIHNYLHAVDYVTSNVQPHWDSIAQNSINNNWVNSILTADERSNAIVELANGESIAIDAVQLVDKNLTNFKGWQCYAGVERMYIDPQFKVYSGQCRNDYIGELFDNNLSLFTEPTVCKQEKCVCVADIFTTKIKNLNIPDQQGT
jgi:MoaA/NifB/PqqE/SkfB family radical SAM enzyme